jgi:hypothetical protein
MYKENNTVGIFKISIVLPEILESELFVPRPEVRFEKKKLLVRARQDCDEMLKFQLDELKGKCF